jgi:hypothetical protein
MRFVTCEHPVRVVDPISGEVRFVPCGKCDLCKGAHAASWVERIKCEMENHPFNWFITLTYDDNNVPRLYRYDHWLVDDENDGFGLCLDDYDFDQWLPIERDFVNNVPFINYLRTSDLQKFFKRLRRQIDLLYPYEENSKIRYFACGEYGETYLRPHFHIILFCDSENVSENMPWLISEAWTVNSVSKGDVKCELCDPKTASYVARYLNCTSHLPQVFQLRPLRPKSFCSKTPFVGYSQFSEEKLQDLVYKSAPTIDSVRRNTDGIVETASVPLWRSLEGYLWPKISHYSRIPYTLRSDLYKLYEGLGITEVESFVNFLFVASCSCDTPMMQLIWNSYVDAGYGCEHDANCRNHFIESVFYAGRRCSVRAMQFGVSLHKYIELLFAYYDCSVPYARLVEWYQFYEDYMIHHPEHKSNFIDYDLSLLSRVRDLPFEDSKARYGLLVESFGLDFERYYYYAGSPSVYDLPVTRDSISLSHTIALNHRKTKRKNEYMKFRNFGSESAYYRNIDNYYTLKGRTNLNL